MDSQETLAFCDLQGVAPRIETMPLEQAGEAYGRMMDGGARLPHRAHHLRATRAV